MPKKNLSHLFIVLIATFFSMCCFIFYTTTAKASGTTYYVSNCGTIGNDSNNGTATSTPWLTIAKVNSSTFNPGDSILLNRSCTWREQMTVPSSGTSGNLITFGAYGSGADPLLNGSSLLNNAGFSPYTLGSSTLYSIIPNNDLATGENAGIIAKCLLLLLAVPLCESD